MTGLEWYPKGSNAFTAHAALKSYVPPPIPGKRRKLPEIDMTLTEEQRRLIKNKRNAELMATKRAALRVNAQTLFNNPIAPRGTLGDSAQARARASI